MHEDFADFKDFVKVDGSDFLLFRLVLSWLLGLPILFLLVGVFVSCSSDAGVDCAYFAADALVVLTLLLVDVYFESIL